MGNGSKPVHFNWLGKKIRLQSAPQHCGSVFDDNLNLHPES